MGPRRHVPDHHDPLAARGRQPLAVGAEPKEPDRAGLRQRPFQQLVARVPGGEAQPEPALKRRRPLLHRQGQPDHPLAGPVADEERRRPLQREPRPRILHLLHRRLLLGLIADVGEPLLQRLGQFQGRRVAVLGADRHRLQADRLKRGVDRPPQPPGGRKHADADPRQHLGGRVAGERRVADQHAVKRRPQAVHVAGRADPVVVAGRLLGAHISRRADRRAGPGHERRSGRNGVRNHFWRNGS